MRVLLVDDHRLVREGLKQILECQDEVPINTVIEAEDGREALQILHRSPVDSVLTDIQMPGMNGIQLTRAIHAEWPDLPILVITMTPDSWWVDVAMDAGATAVLPKTVSADELLEAVAATSAPSGPCNHPLLC